jgi:hypothetical protein
VFLLGALGACLFAGCAGSSTGALEHEACTDVSHSIMSFQRAQHETGAAARSDAAKALVELRRALGPAALAAASSSDYQALAATLTESSRVSEGELIQALSAQCAASLAKS